MAELGPNGEYPNRGLITVMIMLATIMQVLDTTIANVALPSMTGDLGRVAGHDHLGADVSYIVAAAIMTPVTGWLADRIGKRELFLISIVGFVARLAAVRAVVEPVVDGGCSGCCRGFLARPSCRCRQTFLLDINPREKAGSAMAMWGAGIMVGPIIGPTLGRLADRELQLALGVSDQPAGRHHRDAGLYRLSAEVGKTDRAGLTSSALPCCRWASARCN